MALSPNLFVVLVFLVKFVFQTQGDEYFTRGPSNVTVYEEEDATLTCESPYADHCIISDFYYFGWYKGNGTRVADCSATPKFNIYAGEGEYRLTIRNTQPEDSGKYWCELEFYKPILTKQSSRALLTVIPLPKYNPSCTFEPTRPAVGTVTTLKCALSTLDPSSSLTWYKSQPSLTNRLGFQDYTQPGDELYSLQCVLTEADNMREFTCVAGPYYNGPSCSITPLQIPTTVSILPSHLTRHEHENASFTCDFKSTPQQMVSKYEWRVLKGGIAEVEVNQAVLQNLDGQFELENDGRILQIINVTLEEFHNAQIRCIAYYDGTNLTSDNESLLVVLPLTSTATDQSLTTTATEQTSNENNAMNTAASSTVFIVGGVLGTIFFLIIIALLGCYLIKYKHKPTGPGQTAVIPNQNPTTYEIVVTDGDESGPTYEQVPVDKTGEQNRQIPSDFTTQDEVLYTLPDKTGPEIRRYVVSSSSAIDNDGGTVCIENEESIYTMPEKGPRSRPIISDTEDIGPQQKNVEGLAYAELDLQPSQTATQTIINKSVDQSTYADICTEY